MDSGQAAGQFKSMDSNYNMMSSADFSPQQEYQLEQKLHAQVYRLHNRNKPYLSAGHDRVVCAVNGQVGEVPRTFDNINLAERFFARLPFKMRRLAARKTEELAPGSCPGAMSLPQVPDNALAYRVIKNYFSRYDTPFFQFKSRHRSLCNYIRQNNLLATGQCPAHLVSLYQLPDIFEDRLYQIFKVKQSQKELSTLMSFFDRVPCPDSKKDLARAVAQRCVEWEQVTIQHGLCNNELYVQALEGNDDLSSQLTGACASTKQFFLQAVSVLKQYQTAVWQDRELIHSSKNAHDFAVLLEQKRAESANRIFGEDGLVSLQEEIVVRLRSYVDSKQCVELATGNLMIPVALSDNNAECFKTYVAALLRHYHQFSDFRGQQSFAHIGNVESLLNICRVFLQIMQLTGTEW